MARRNSLRGLALVLVVVLGGFFGGAARAADDATVAAFYKGKRIRIVVGYGVGGGFDISARLIARHIPKYIPGNPSVIVENRPGAGGIIAANAVYNNEPADGTVIVSFTAGLALQQAVGQPVQFDARKFQWLGSTFDSYSVCVVRSDSGVASFEDARHKQIVMASQAVGNFTYAIPLLLNSTAGTRFKVNPGYGSVPNMFLALQNGEASGICIGYLEVILPLIGNLLEGDRPMLKPLIVLTATNPGGPHLQGVPAVDDVVKDAAGRALMQTLHYPDQITFPYAVAPGVPQERVAALRTALAETYRDPAFLRDAAKAGMGVAPHDGAAVTQIIDNILATPSKLIGKLKPLLWPR